MPKENQSQGEASEPPPVPSAPTPTPTQTSSTSTHSRGKSLNDKAISVRAVRSNTKQSHGDRPSSSVSKAKGSKPPAESRPAQQKPLANPYIYQMAKMTLSSPTMMHWSRAPVSGMLPSRHLRAHSMTLVESVIWIFGGTDESDSRDDIYTLDTETFIWGKPMPLGDLPPPSRAHTATLVQNRYIFIVGGGQDFVYYNNVFIFDTLTHRWSRPDIQGEKPIARRAHTACLHNGRLFIFGGGNGTVALNDVWAMDVTVPFDKLRWEQIKPREGAVPSPRGYHTSNLVGNVMVIIGGSDGRDCYSDIWVMDLDTYLWKEVKPDEKYSCMFHSSTQVGSYLFVLGGHNGASFVSDLVLFNLVTLQYESRSCAGRTFPPRGYHGAVLADSRLIVTGGFDGESVFEDVSVLDLAALAYLPQVTRFGIIIDEQGVYVEDEGAEYQEEGYVD